jgi:uncharacterized membrane protein
MSEVPVQVMVAAFTNEDKAKRAVERLKQAKQEGLIDVIDGALLRKDESGELHIQETTDWGGGRGAAIGGAAGAAIGLFAGPLLVVPAAVGALIGGLASKLHDSTGGDDRLKTIGEGLEPGTSAIIVVVELTWVEKVRREIEQAGADMVAEALQADIAEQLQAGHDVAYAALATQGGFAMAREERDAAGVAGQMLLVGEDEEAGVSYVATPDGFVAYGADATPEGLIMAGIAAPAASSSRSKAR